MLGLTGSHLPLGCSVTLDPKDSAKQQAPRSTSPHLRKHWDTVSVSACLVESIFIIKKESNWSACHHPLWSSPIEYGFAQNPTEASGLPHFHQKRTMGVVGKWGGEAVTSKSMIQVTLLSCYISRSNKYTGLCFVLGRGRGVRWEGRVWHSVNLLLRCSYIFVLNPFRHHRTSEHLYELPLFLTHSLFLHYVLSALPLRVCWSILAG